MSYFVLQSGGSRVAKVLPVDTPSRAMPLRENVTSFSTKHLGNENEARAVFAKETAPPLPLFLAIIPSV